MSKVNIKARKKTSAREATYKKIIQTIHIFVTSTDAKKKKFSYKSKSSFLAIHFFGRMWFEFSKTVSNSMKFSLLLNEN